MIELTDEDRAAIGAVWQLFGSPIKDKCSRIDEEIYLAGLRAGLERAAKICDARAQTWDQPGLLWKEREIIVLKGESECLVQAIRAAIGEKT